MTSLYQFAGSHYCEKVRWALDYKRVDYETINLIPGLHGKPIKRLAKTSQVPVLVDGKSVVQGSAEIITYLDKTAKFPQLTPSDPQARSMAIEWERYLDRNVGIPLRLLFYHDALQDRKLATQFLLTGAPWWGRPFYAVAFPGIRRAMKKFMRINPQSADAARGQLVAAFEKIDERLQAHKFLAGEQFSRADLCASALLFHRWSPQWPAPRKFDEFIREYEHRPFYLWAEEIYRNNRSKNLQ